MLTFDLAEFQGVVAVSLIRVLVANRPRLILELVTATISDQPDIEVVGEVAEEEALERAVDTQRPDVLIVALDHRKDLPREYQVILRQHPQMKMVAISPGEKSSRFYWTSLNIESQQIETSEAGVLGAIRADAQTAHSQYRQL